MRGQKTTTKVFPYAFLSFTPSSISLFLTTTRRGETAPHVANDTILRRDMLLYSVVHGVKVSRDNKGIDGDKQKPVSLKLQQPLHGWTRIFIYFSYTPRTGRVFITLRRYCPSIASISLIRWLTTNLYNVNSKV